MIKSAGIYIKILLLMVAFLLMAAFVPGVGKTDHILSLLSICSFLFGIFLAFAISSSQTKFNLIRSTLRRDDALVLYIYKVSGIFGEKVQEQCREVLDNYLVTSLDYLLYDFGKSNPEFYKLFDFFSALDPKGEKEKEAYKQALGAIKESIVNKKQINYLLGDRILKFEWASILSLGLIILISLFLINDNSTISIIITMLLATSLSLFVLILRELDKLSWKEKSWVWDPLTTLFIELGLKPYIPADVLKFGKAKLRKGVSYRVAYYSHSYPDFSDKKIELLKID